MLKYLAVFALVFGLAVYISIQDERTTQKPTAEATQPDKGRPSTNADENHPQNDISNSEGNTPSWYGFFRWPNGTTTWAVLLTLLVIAEQTKQTASAAKFAEKSAKAFINKERSRLFLQQEIDTKFCAKFRVVNRGQSPAKITYAYVEAELLRPEEKFQKVPNYARFDDPENFVRDDWVLPGKSCDIDDSDNDFISEEDNPELFESVMNGKDILWLYGIVRYQDSVSEDEHSIRFCFKCWPSRTGKNFLFEDGPAAYRGET